VLKKTKALEILVPASINQGGSTVAGNQVAGSIYDYSTTINEASREASVLELLLRRLQVEVENEMHCEEMIVKLRRFHGGTVADGVRGLTAKLDHAGRSYEIDDALEQKEMFAKLLETWSLYASAQEIFAYLLARAECLFKSEILPEIRVLRPVEVNKLVNERIVEPTVNECGATVLQLDHLTAKGMVYWLAEQCFVRWH
jgi:hypothetical protein